jgi:hypothetical protein
MSEWVFLTFSSKHIPWIMGTFNTDFILERKMPYLGLTDMRIRTIGRVLQTFYRLVLRTSRLCRPCKFMIRSLYPRLTWYDWKDCLNMT